MFILKLVRFIRGYVRISVEGSFPERLINLLTNENIAMWDIVKTEGKLFVTIRAYEFLRLKNICERADCRAKIIEKKGLLFALKKGRKRQALFIFAALFACAILYSSTILWSIDIVGDDFTQSNMLFNVLEREGLKTGMPLKSIDPEKIENRVIMACDDIAWITINLHGTRAEVKAVPRKEAPKVIDKDAPCNLVSVCDGVLEHIEVYEGTAEVKEGEAFTEGQLLVSGIFESKTQGIYYTHASATVLARTWLSVEKELPDFEYIKDYSGRKITKNALLILGRRINLFFDSGIPYENYDKIIIEKEMHALGLKIPARLLSLEASEYTLKKEPLSEETAKLKLRTMCDAELFSKYNDIEIINCDVKFTKTEDSYIMKADYECVMPAAREAEIVLSHEKRE